MRIFSFMLDCSVGDAHFDFETLAFARTNCQVAAHAACTGTHPDHTHAALSRATGRKATAVVADGKAYLVVTGIERDRGVLGAGMTRHVGESFLRQPEQVRFSFVGETAGDGR